MPVSVEYHLAPREGQPVFERSLPSRTTKSLRVAMTALLVLANLVQVSKKHGSKQKKLTRVDDSQFRRYCWREHVKRIIGC
jgi:hypothetical protein